MKLGKALSTGIAEERPAHRPAHQPHQPPHHEEQPTEPGKSVPAPDAERPVEATAAR
ncbi:hypothetical protein ABZ953_23915 [Streptomyces sp. NPDC046465]|uniref:hypothetical protein n=1 Tax=Streptomyces sp. NPDC046465 TaxID=3155810 RepID=UPI0033C59E38